jgi:L-alanine-DL-glutamate epimerase-like enolase superfamily enzyme
LVEAPGGFMRVPQGPGLGIDVDEAVLRKYRVN